METESRLVVEREEKLRKVEEKLLSNKTNERFTNYAGVMSDPNLTLAEKINHLQKAIDDATRRKIHHTSLQGELFEKCCLRSKKGYEEILEETKFSRQWVLFLRKLYRLALKYNQVHVSIFGGLSGSEDRGGGDNSIQFINIGRVGDKSFKE